MDGGLRAQKVNPLNRMTGLNVGKHRVMLD